MFFLVGGCHHFIYSTIDFSRQYANIRFSFIKCSWGICRIEQKSELDCKALPDVLNWSLSQYP